MASDTKRILPHQHTRAKSSSALLTTQAIKPRESPKSRPQARAFRETKGNTQAVPVSTSECSLPTQVPDSENIDPKELHARERKPGLSRRSKSAVSLRALVSSNEPKKPREPTDKPDQSPAKKSKKEKKVVKTKSSTGLSSMFAKFNKSSKNLGDGNSEESAFQRTDSSTASRSEINSTKQVPLERATARQRTKTERPLSRAGRPRSLIVTATKELGEMLSRQGSADRSQLSSRGSDSSCTSRGDATSLSRFSIERFRSADAADHRKTSSSSCEQPPTGKGLLVGKRGSRVMAAVAAIDEKHRQAATPKAARPTVKPDPKQVEQDFEAVLIARNIPEDQRQKMRTLTIHVKADFVRQDQVQSPTKSIYESDKSGKHGSRPAAADKKETDTPSQTRRSRPRSKTFTFAKPEPSSPNKRQKSASRPLSINGSDSLQKGLSALLSPSRPTHVVTNTPSEFVAYLRSSIDPVETEVGRLHKLRLLLRNETVIWVHDFIELGGMQEVANLLHRIMAVEWREDHEDQLLHETLLCLKGLCTTEVAVHRLDQMADKLFPPLVNLIFDEERKGPSEFSTRGIIFSVLLAYLGAELASARTDGLECRAQKILRCLEGPAKDQDSRAVPFVLEMRARRPYCVWCKELSNVVKEVFWIFLHHGNAIAPVEAEANLAGTPPTTATLTYAQRHFPRTRPPTPAAPYIGGVEWDATNYLATHLDLLNGLIASLTTVSARNSLRSDLAASGFEKIMGETLRTCKEKFYPYIHDALRLWVSAATEDGWTTSFVRHGPTMEQRAERAVKQLHSPSRKRPSSPEKEAAMAPPRLDMDVPQLDLGFNGKDFLGGAMK